MIIPIKGVTAKPKKGLIFTAIQAAATLATPKIAAVERSGNVSYPDEQHDRGEILAKSYLEAIIDTIAPQGIKARWGISTGSESEMIISRTESNSIGVIAIATKLKSKIRRVFLNNLLNELFRKTNVPVLVINTNNNSYVEKAKN